MLNVKGFYDYCVNEACLSSNYHAAIKYLYECGYRTIAINQCIDTSQPEPRKIKRKGEPAPVALVAPKPYLIKPVGFYEDMKILNRLTIAFENQDQLSKITKSENYKKYAIIAILPLTNQALKYAASCFDADILTFNPEIKCKWRNSRSLYKQFIQRGYHFEILYSPAIDDRIMRRNIINLSHVYHTYIKSKNVVISSGAKNLLEIRPSYDVINLGGIFGLNESQAKDCILESGRKLFLNSVGRRHGKAVMLVEDLEDVSNEEILVEDMSLEDISPEESSEVIALDESEEDEDTNQPAGKKRKYICM